MSQQVRPIILSLLLPVLLLISIKASANDGFAARGVGGVTMAKTDVIAIKSEVLDVSCERIQVSYEFINESDRDETALIMFPLPPYPAQFSESGDISHGQPSGFTITVEGKPVHYDTQVKATLDGRDVTGNLLAAGLSLEQIAHFPFDRTLLSSNHEVMLPPDQIAALTPKGLGEAEWDIHVTFVWEQIFPAGKVVQVEHAYRPFIAEGTNGGYPGWEPIDQFCPSEQQLKQLQALHADERNLDGYNQVPGTNLKYILTTANSWKDGVRDFTLRIHAKAKDEIVAFCFPSPVTRVADTLYEARINNFRPVEELFVFFGNAKNCESNGYGEPPRFK